MFLTLACLQPLLKGTDRVQDTHARESGTIDSSELCTGWYDLDEDGFGAGVAIETRCDSLPDNMVQNGDDCDDSNEDIHPAAAEICNSLDDDCDGTADSSTVCPCLVQYNDDRPYLFCADAMNWSGAEGHCSTQENYHLVVIDDLSEQSWVWARTKDHGASHWWWIGFHNLEAASWEEPDGKWKWVNGELSTYTHWYSTEPYVQPDDTGNNEDCAHIDPSHGYWNDLDCSSSNWNGTPSSWVCEGDPPS